MGNVKQCLFGAALVNIRESLQISQYQLAKRTGIAEEYLNKLENSKREPKAVKSVVSRNTGLHGWQGVPFSRSAKLNAVKGNPNFQR